jgi:hypothetical protein
MDSSIASKASHMTLGLLKLFFSNTRTVNRFGETNFLDFLSFGCGDNDEDDRFLLVDLGVYGEVRLEF